MQPSPLNLDEITEFDLHLAKNDRALVFAQEIVKLSLEERTQRRQKLQRKIQDGTASLFEENVLTKLLEQRTAEKIGDIHQNLAFVEAAFKKRQPAIAKAAVPPNISSATRTVRADEYPSELLAFLASQKPPTPPTKKSAEQSQSSLAASAPDKKRTLWSVKDLAVGSALVLGFALALWYTVASEKPLPTPATFDRQAAAGSTASGETKETLAALQTQFDEALQQLRFGVFDQGQAQLFKLMQDHPQSAQAQDAYLAIADTYRQRQNNPAEALKYYQTFTEQYPQSPRIGLVQLKMGFAYEDLEDSGNAAEIYRLIVNQQGAKSRLGQLASERLQALKTQ